MRTNSGTYPVRSYSKGELAHLYNPDKTYFTALKIFRQWIAANKELEAALAASGYRNKCKIFSPYQTSLIFQYLGPPEQ